MDLNSASIANGTVYFYDDFESGLGNWIVSGYDWGLTDSTSRSSSHSLTDSPVGNYLPNSNCSATLADPLDLSGAVDPVLVFWHKGSMSCCNDYLYVDVSTDGGTNWTAVHHYGSPYAPIQQSTWSLEQFDLGLWKSSSVKVRFRLVSDGNESVDDGSYVDDVRIEEKDTLRLTYPFADDFESGLGNWIVSGYDWGLTDSTSRSSSHSLTDSPVGTYLPNSDCSATLVHPLDLSGALDPVLMFWHKGSMSCCNDYLYVDVSTDGGTNWTAVHHYGSPYAPIQQSTWSLEQFDLGDWKGISVKVRFRLASDGGGDVDDGWRVDDVRIEEKNTLPPVTYPFADDFESGLGNWIVSGHDWDTTTSTSRSSSHSLTDSPVGAYLPNSNCSATLADPLDLSGALDPVLRFWHKGSMSCCNDYLYVDVSTDGGTNWTEVHHYGSPYAPIQQSTWSPEQFDLGNWSSVKVRFRLVSDGGGDVDDGWYVDDVRIEPKVSTFLLNYLTSGSGSGIKVQWTLSTMDQGVSFYAYRATNLSNDYAWINVDVVSPNALAYEFLDSDVEPGHAYRYKITVKNETGSRVLFETESIAAPKAPLALYQNNPNPFNPSTTIGYYIPEKCLVKLEVYDVVGARVARLVSSEKASGYHSVEWKGLGDDGDRVASGVYFYRLTAGKKMISRKMLLLQ